VIPFAPDITLVGVIHPLISVSKPLKNGTGVLAKAELTKKVKPTIAITKLNMYFLIFFHLPLTPMFMHFMV